MPTIYVHEQKNDQVWRGEWERIYRTSSDRRARARAAAAMIGGSRGR